MSQQIRYERRNASWYSGCLNRTWGIILGALVLVFACGWCSRGGINFSLPVLIPQINVTQTQDTTWECLDDHQALSGGEDDFVFARNVDVWEDYGSDRAWRYEANEGEQFHVYEFRCERNELWARIQINNPEANDPKGWVRLTTINYEVDPRDGRSSGGLDRQPTSSNVDDEDEDTDFGDCPADIVPHLAYPILGQVENTHQEGNRVRTGPSKSSRMLILDGDEIILPINAEFAVIGDSVCDEDSGMFFMPIVYFDTVLDELVEGWMAQGDDERYWVDRFTALPRSSSMYDEISDFVSASDPDNR